MHLNRISLVILLGGLSAVLATSTNQAPVFTPPTSLITIVENESGQLPLYTLTVSDPDGDAVTCSLQSTNPSTSDFGVLFNSTDYEVYLLAGSSLQFTTTPVYTLTLECSDGADSTSMNISVLVTPNTPPTFTNLPATTSNKNANNVGLGAVIYTVTATDTDSTSLTYSMTSRPVSPAIFEIDAVSGAVKATQDLIYALNRAYDLTITVSDSRDNTTSNLIIPITNVNTAPIINNLPNTVHVKETTNSNTGLFDLSISDPNNADTVTITYVVSPSVYTSKFYLSGQRIRLADSFNYEEQSNFTLTFTVSDGKTSTSNSDYVLNVIIEDVNENCAFEYSVYFATMQEGNVGGSTVDPGFTVTDDDSGGALTLSLQNIVNASFFTIDTATGLISFAVNYDVDGAYPTNPYFRVYCTDNYGQTGSHTTLYVTVEDVNDNAPRFNDTGYILYFDQTMAVPHDIGSISATDADTGDNAAMDYSWSTTGNGNTYFSFASNGVIVLQKDPEGSLSYGTTFRFVVMATDRGSPPLTGTTTVDLVYQKIILPTTTITTNATTTTIGTQPTSANDNSFLEEPANIRAIAVGSALGVALCGIAAFVIWKNLDTLMGPTRKRPKKIEPKIKTEKRPFDFWSTSQYDSTKSLAKNVSSKPVPVETANEGPSEVFTF